MFNEELRTLRRMLETQLATLRVERSSRRAPIQTELLRQLTVLGLAHDLSGELVSQIPQRMELAEAHRLALAMLARRIETVGERWMESGGVVAMVGPTGVGKTTLIAKLAARWVMRHGPRDLALDVDGLHPHRRAGTDSHARSPARRAGVRDRRRGGISPRRSIRSASAAWC